MVKTPSGTGQQWRRLQSADILACQGHKVAIDVETTGLEWWRDKLIGVGFHCPDANVSGYYPTLTDSERMTVKVLVAQMTVPGTVVIAHNLKFEWHFLDINPYRYPQVQWVDTTVMVHLIDSRYSKALDNVEKVWLKSNTKNKFVGKAPHGKKNKIWEWPLDLVAAYCINDVRVEYDLAGVLAEELRRWGLVKLFQKDMRYLRSLWDSERHGILLDPVFLHRAHDLIEEHRQEMEQTLWDSVGYQFNWRSTKQLSRALYEDMGIARPKNPYADADGVDRSKFADRGMYNETMTSTFILMEKTHHPLGELIASLREANNLATTLNKWLKMKDADDVIHGGFNLTGTRTGRLSSSKPNLQNVASDVRTRFLQSVYSGERVIRSDEYNLRTGFIARPGKMFASVDWSQMEMRMFGILSKDPFMLDSLRAGRDIHADIAEKVWGMRDEVHREWAKTISFGLIYGMTTGSVMHRLNMTFQQAKQVTDEYWATFPRIQPWLQQVVEECRDQGFVRYWSGRLWREESPEHFYKGANAKIQGGCADVLSVAALRTTEWLQENLGDEGHIVNYIHDELMVEVPEEAVPDTVRALSDIMALPDLFDLPWKTSPKVGKTYGTLEKYEL